MGKKTGLFNKILVGLLSLAIILGLASPVLANDKGDRFSYEVDMVIVVDISGSMSGTKMTKAKKSAKDMAEAIWKEQESHNISTNIALISFASSLNKDSSFVFFSSFSILISLFFRFTFCFFLLTRSLLLDSKTSKSL
jgi:hypothetical protein